MTIQQAQQQLKEHRAALRVLRRDIDEIRAFLKSKGVDPDSRQDNSSRNKKIYNLREKGLTFKAIGEKVGLATATVTAIYKREQYRRSK